MPYAVVGDGTERVQRVALGGQSLLGALDLRHEARRRDDRIRGPFEQGNLRFEVRDVLLSGRVASMGGLERLGQWRPARAWRARSASRSSISGPLALGDDRLGLSQPLALLLQRAADAAALDAHHLPDAR